MSWSVAIPTTSKQEAVKAITDFVPPIPLDGPMQDQCDAAKRAAIELVKSVPGPQIVVYMSGHANGIGWHPKAGWSNDTITVTVGQYFPMVPTPTTSDTATAPEKE